MDRAADEYGGNVQTMVQVMRETIDKMEGRYN